MKRKKARFCQNPDRHGHPQCFFRIGSRTRMKTVWCGHGNGYPHFIFGRDNFEVRLERDQHIGLLAAILRFSGGASVNDAVIEAMRIMQTIEQIKEATIDAAIKEKKS